jgi:hypothetical protein
VRGEGGSKGGGDVQGVRGGWMIEEADWGGGVGDMRGLRVVCVGGSGQCLTHPVSPEVRDIMCYVAWALVPGEGLLWTLLFT